MLSSTISTILNVVQNAHKANTQHVFCKLCCRNATVTNIRLSSVPTLKELLGYIVVMLLTRLFTLMRSLPTHTLFSLTLVLH